MQHIVIKLQAGDHTENSIKHIENCFETNNISEFLLNRYDLDIEELLEFKKATLNTIFKEYIAKNKTIIVIIQGCNEEILHSFIPNKANGESLSKEGNSVAQTKELDFEECMLEIYNNGVTTEKATGSHYHINAKKLGHVIHKIFFSKARTTE